MAIVDIRMPPTHTDEGLVAAQEIRSAHPEVGVLVLSHYVESRYAMRLLEEHPERSGYLLKERVSDVAVLVDALQRIDEGECVLDPTIVSRLVGKPRDESPLAELTERELEVLSLMAEGHSNDGISQKALPQPEDRRDARASHPREARDRRDLRLPPPSAGRPRLSASLTTKHWIAGVAWWVPDSAASLALSFRDPHAAEGP